MFVSTFHFIWFARVRMHQCWNYNRLLTHSLIPSKFFFSCVMGASFYLSKWDWVFCWKREKEEKSYVAEPNLTIRMDVNKWFRLLWERKKKRYWHTKSREKKNRAEKNALKHKSIENEIGASKFMAIENGEKWGKFVNLPCH